MHSLKDFSSSAHPVTEYPDDAQHPSTEDIIPTHAFVSALLARRTRSLGKGGRRGAVVIVRGGIFFQVGVSEEVFFSFLFLMVLRRVWSVVAAGGGGEGGSLGWGAIELKLLLGLVAEGL